MIINLPMKDTPLTFKLYSVCPQAPERNAIVDGLEMWLTNSNSLITTITSTNPFELSMTQFKLNASDSNAFIVSAQVQYMSVTWNTVYHAYYWIKKITRSSNDVITLDIELDVLNTLHNGDDYLGSRLANFHGTSSIERQHEDRFYEGHSIIGQSSTPAPVDLIPKVDRVLENSQVALHRLPTSDISFNPKATSQEVHEIDSARWFLVYATNPQTNDLACYLVPNVNVEFFDTSYDTHYACRFDKIIRTSSRISKIIALPYCPVNFSKETHNNKTAYVFPNCGAVQDNNVFSALAGSMAINIDIEKIAENNLKPMPLVRTLTNSDYENMIIPERYRTLFYKPRETLLQDSKFILDSKLDNSEFKGIYFVYDSFVLQIEEENFDHDSPFTFNIVYAQSPDVDSAFIFKIVPSDDYLSGEYYSLIMSSDRKNEVAVYSSDYLNYIRNGYNYDKTKKDITNIMSIISSSAGFVGSIATGNVLGAVGTGMSLAKSITGAVTSELSMEQKLKELGSKAISVSGVSDSSLFYYYSDNRPKLVIQKPTQNELNRWNDIFYYYGYNRAGIMGVPNVTSRVWFNFLKGEIVLAEANEIPLWLYEKAKAKYREGVTYYHFQTINGQYAWDLEQTKENYETFLLGL